MSKKNILEETLTEIQELRKAVSENANHALKSTLKEELEEIVKNNLKEEVVLSEELTDDMPGVDLPGDLDEPGEEEVSAIEPEESEEEEKPEGEEPEGEESDEEESEEVIDLTDKSDEDVIKHFELMNPADEIEIIQTPEGGVQININPEEGEEEAEEIEAEEEPTTDVVKFEPEELEESNEVSEEPKEESDEEMVGKEEEPVHEIEISEEDAASLAEIDNVEEEVEEAEVKEEIVDETVQEVEDVKTKEKELHESLVIMRKKYQEVVSENNKKTKELSEFKNLTEEFKGSEEEYKSAIKNLKSQLQEVALFSSNLTYAIKLITENSTTKNEKLEILSRFDSAENLSESREIFNNMQSQFNSNKVTVKQMVEEKIMETPKSSGSSKLNESTAYQDPQLSRILDIIGKIK